VRGVIEASGECGEAAEVSGGEAGARPAGRRRCEERGLGGREGDRARQWESDVSFLILLRISIVDLLSIRMMGLYPVKTRSESTTLLRSPFFLDLFLAVLPVVGICNNCQLRTSLYLARTRIADFEGAQIY
jgi:hypothetical protein